MSYITTSFVLLLCFDIMPSDARRLGFVDSMEIEKQAGFSKQDGERVNYNKILIHHPTKMMDTFSKKEGDEVIYDKNLKGLSNQIKEAIQGYKMIVMSLKVGPHLQEPRELKRQARSLLGPSIKDNNESVDSKEEDVGEEIVVMDYAQPHRKPPIHNEKH